MLFELHKNNALNMANCKNHTYRKDGITHRVVKS